MPQRLLAEITCGNADSPKSARASRYNERHRQPKDTVTKTFTLGYCRSYDAAHRA
jgi:hypothetical protein